MKNAGISTTGILDKIITFLKIGIIIISVLIVLFLIADKIVMPMYVHLGDEIEMPDVTEHDYAEALVILKQHGFKVKKEGKYDPYHNVDVVLFQNPAPYTTVKRGRLVRLTVSLGEQLAKVPDLIGISERDAEIRLSERNLKLGEKIPLTSSYPAGIIISQQYEPMMEVKKWTVINITVSIGPEQSDVIMPNLINKSLREAENIIRGRGLYIGNVEYLIKNKYVPNTILNQFPSPGAMITIGDTVFFSVSKIDSTFSR